MEQLELDHVILGVPDLDEAAAVLLVRHGLVAAPGGEHPAWGTRNRIVPLGTCYLEIVEVVDPVVAQGSGFGRWIAAMAEGRAAWGWVVRTNDIEATAGRLGLEVASGSRLRPDGVRISWRNAGIPESDDQRDRPFVVQWDEGVPLPGSAEVPHPAAPVSMRSLHVSGDGLAAWLGGPVPGVEIEDGAGGVDRIELVAATGTLTLAQPLEAPAEPA